MEIDYLKVQLNVSSDEIADVLDYIQGVPYGQLTSTIEYHGGGEVQITIETSRGYAASATVESLLQKVMRRSGGTRNTDRCYKKGHTVVYEKTDGIEYMHCLTENWWFEIGADYAE
jgi:hypothetical protein